MVWYVQDLSNMVAKLIDVASDEQSTYLVSQGAHLKVLTKKVVGKIHALPSRQSDQEERTFKKRKRKRSSK